MDFTTNITQQKKKDVVYVELDMNDYK
jgi:hypothetical protein